MLKLMPFSPTAYCAGQPPSGGCVLKPIVCDCGLWQSKQPPSGGCVLKRIQCLRQFVPPCTAAFRRLCVETERQSSYENRRFTAAFRRLCVETRQSAGRARHRQQPPSGGCVLKRYLHCTICHAGNTAAFRRLCVETFRATLVCGV